MSQITTHILDTARGRPAEGVVIVLFRHENSHWTEIARGVTNINGRNADLLPLKLALSPGTYKMKFETRDYFDKLTQVTLYPFIEIVFDIANEEHYHIPLLVSPFGYSTYRGS